MLDGYKGPFIMMNNRSLLSEADASNMLKGQAQQIINESLITAPPGDGNEVLLWADLPSGLYITNTWRSNDCLNNGDPMMEEANGFSRQYYYQNQFIIPINLPYGTEIIGIDIPIYFYNIDAVAAVTVTASAALMFGNYVHDSTISTGDGYNYIADPTTSAAWAYKRSTINPNLYTHIRLTTDVLTAGNNLYNNDETLQEINIELSMPFNDIPYMNIFCYRKNDEVTVIGAKVRKRYFLINYDES